MNILKYSKRITHSSIIFAKPRTFYSWDVKTIRRIESCRDFYVNLVMQHCVIKYLLSFTSSVRCGYHCFFRPLPYRRRQISIQSHFIISREFAFHFISSCTMHEHHYTEFHKYRLLKIIFSNWFQFFLANYSCQIRSIFVTSLSRSQILQSWPSIRLFDQDTWQCAVFGPKNGIEIFG